MNNSKTEDGDDATQAQEAVGQLLRETRLSQGLDVADVARVLRISQKYLEALEDGRNSDLPGTAYAIGFVRSYGEHLNLDGEEIVRRYKDEDVGLGDKTQLVFPKPIPEGGVPGAAVLGLGVIIAFVAYGVWYWNSNNDDITVAHVDPVPEHLAVKNTKSKPETPKAFVKIETPKPIEKELQPAVEVKKAVEETVAETKAVVKAEVAAVEDAAGEDAVAPDAVAESDQNPAPQKEVKAVTEDVVAKTVDEVAVPEETPVVKDVVAASASKPKPKAAVNKGPSRVTVRAKANSWIQIRDSIANRLLFTRLLREGDEYEVPNRAGLRLMTGNAGALEVLVDGKAVPSIGDVGVVRRDVDLDPEKLKSGAAITD